MVMSVRRIFVGAVMSLVLAGVWGGCTDQRQEATASMQHELAARKEDRAKSAKLTCQGMEELDKNNPKEARRLFGQALEHDKRNADAWMAMGLIGYRQGDWHEAAIAFHRASRLEPNRYEPQYNIGLVLESAGQYERAVERYEAALKLTPDNFQVMENLARCYITLGIEPEKSIELVEKALRQETRPEWTAWLSSQSHNLKRKVEVVNGK